MTTKKEMVRINDAAQALLQSKIDPMLNIDMDATNITVDPSSASTKATAAAAAAAPVPPAVLEKVLRAVRDGDVEQLRFLSNHVNGFTKICDSEGMPLLHVATSVDRVDIMELLVALGCNINGLDERGGTAVLEAASVGSLKGMKFLIKAGIKGGVARPDARGDTTLHLASGKGRVHMMDWLLEQGCDLEAKTVDFKARPLQYAICHDKEESVRWLIKKGVDLRALDNAYGWNALHVAAANGRSNMCDMLCM